MALSEKEIGQYLPYLKEALEGKRILKVALYDDRAFYFDIQGYGDNRLAIILDDRDPRIYLAERIERFKSLETKFYEQMKKEVNSSIILNIEELNEDRILCFRLRIINQVFKEEIRYLVFEMIPLHVNLVVLDEQKKIITSFRPGSLQDTRPLLRGLPYTLPHKPERKSLKEEINWDNKSYLLTCLEKEKQIQDKRKKELFGPLLKSIERRIKQLERKKERLEEQAKEAANHLNDGEIGNLIYTYFDDIAKGSDHYEIDGYVIKLDPRKSLSENAEMYFKRAKKAKETLRYTKQFLENAEEEKQELEASFAQLIASDESGLELLSKDLGITPLPGRKGREKLALTSSTLPYMVSYKGVNYLYGKNAKQNDCLTFLYCTARNHAWLHVLGDSGAHLIIKKDYPSEEEKRFGAELALLASSKEDGDVMCTPRKFVNKGPNSGQVKVKEFETIHIKEIRQETRDAFSQSVRWIPNH